MPRTSSDDDSPPPNRLRYWRDALKLSRKDLATRVNTSPGQIQKLETGERKLTQEWMERIAPVLGRHPADLMPEHELSSMQWAQERHREKMKDSSIEELGGGFGLVRFGGQGYLPVGVYDIRASAGPGSINEEPAVPISHAFFRMRWIRSITQAPVNQLAVIRVSGDSMWDTLHDGDNVLIDRTAVKVGRDGIYVIRLGDELQVKRIARHPSSKLLTVKSDNPAYPAFPDVPADDLHVVGRVIWLGRHLG